MRGVVFICNRLNQATDFTWNPVLGDRGTAFSIRPAAGNTTKQLHYCYYNTNNYYYYYWWRGVVDNVFRLKRSYSTLGPVSTAMGDCLRQVNHLGAKPAG